MRTRVVRRFLVGGGGHGRVVLDALLSNGVEISGILDRALTPETSIFGVRVLGDLGYLADIDPDDALLLNGIGANPRTEARTQVFESLCADGFGFDVLRHGTAIVGGECRIDVGSQIMAGAVLQAGVSVGENVVVNTQASIDHDTELAPHSFVGPGAVLCGDVMVGRNAFVGAGAIVCPGVRIGASAVIGAGAVVVSDISDGSICVGNPARQIGTMS